MVLYFYVQRTFILFVHNEERFQTGQWFCSGDATAAYKSFCKINDTTDVCCREPNVRARYEVFTRYDRRASNVSGYEERLKGSYTFRKKSVSRAGTRKQRRHQVCY